MELQLSVWSEYFYEKTPEEQVMLFKENGFDAMELSVEAGELLLSRGNLKQTGREFRRYILDHGFEIPQGHLKLECDICSDSPQALIEELKSWIELYTEIGIKMMVFHSGGFDKRLTRAELLKRRLFAFRQLMPLLNGTDHYLCLENLVTIIPHSDELLETIDAVGSPNMAICLDTGHLNMGGNWTYQETLDDFFCQCGKYIKALHIADNDGRTDQHLMPLVVERAIFEEEYSARVNIYRLIELLRTIDYKGLFNFEIPGESRCPMELRLKKLEYIKLMAQYYIDFAEKTAE